MSTLPKVPTTVTIVWTLLPNGLNSNGQLRMSAIASLRPATGDGLPTTLDKFEDLLHWPTTVKKLLKSPKVQFAHETTPRVARVEDATAPDEQLWNSIFPASTVVRPYVFEDRSAKRIFSFGASQVADIIYKLYDDAADGKLHDDCCGIRKAICEATVLGQRAAAAMPISQLVMPGKTDAAYFANGGPYASPVSQQTTQFARGNLFYNRGRAISNSLPANNWESDFLQMLAAISSQPAILRTLGIVVDLLVDSPLPVPARTRISLVGLSDLRNAALHTSVALSATSFRAVPLGTTSDISDNGLLKLNEPSRYVVRNMEIDGSMIKVSDNALKQNSLPTDDSLPPLSVLPALRSSGITVLRVGRDLYIASRLARQAAINRQLTTTKTYGNETYILPQRQPIILTADDILRGYRVDVFSAGTWHSLCYRVGTVEVRGHSPIELPSKLKLEAANKPTDLAEGYVCGTSATKQTDDESRLNIHEAVFGWDGWSLVASRPGRSIPANPEDTAPKQVHNVTPADAGYKYSVQTNVKAQPGTLPKLRYGASYKLRARVVDLAGNSIPLESAPDDHASSPVIYTRFEPIVAPVLVACTPFTEGESCEHVVIRSNNVGSTDDYVGIINNYAKPGAPYSATCKRWIAPPKVAQNVAEMHGMFDVILKPEGPPNTVSNAAITRAYVVAKKESGTFLDTHALDTSQNVILVQKDRAVITPPGIRNTGEITPRGAALSQGQYVIHPNLPTLPYLPDPLAAGFTLLKYEGDNILYKDIKAFSTYSWAGPWPDLLVGFLTLQEGTSILPGFSVSQEGVTVLLRKGTMLTVTYASTITQRDIAKMAIFNSTTQDTSAIAAGKHPMFTPSRKITFVHAVQRPTTRPVVISMVADRVTPGDTFVTVKGTVRGEQANNPIGNSTDSIAAKATWEDFIDLPGDKMQDPTVPVQFYACPFQVKIAYDDNLVELLGPKTSSMQTSILRHELGDTKARVIKYKFVGTTRYREYFPVQITNDPEMLSITGPETLVSIASSARPPVPKIMHIIPTFRWETTANNMHKRAGRGLRIYVDRPWYVSGTKEKLAVLLSSTPEVSTLLGRDPIWATDYGALQLNPADFMPSDAPMQPSIGQYYLANTSTVVTAISYDPQFDHGRKLWYFDIEMSQKKQKSQLMVRLALARLQPTSLFGLELSEVVFADYASLIADRTSSVTKQGASILVTVMGNFLIGPDGAVLGRNVIAQIEKIESLNPDPDDLGWLPYGNSVTLKAQLPISTDDFGVVSILGKLPTVLNTDALSTYRLSIRELEYYVSDDDTKEGVGFVSRGAPSIISEPYRTRIVYACILPL